MNERIKELLTPKLKEWGGASGDNFSEELEKFAELIVKECVWRSQGCHLADGYKTADLLELGYKKGVDNVTSQIKQHFGVEE